MKYIQKREKEPVEFTNWKHQENASLESCFKLEVGAANCAFDKLPSNPPFQEDPGIHYYSKKQLKGNLLEEQGFICAYCTKGLDNDHHCTIDHLEPKAADPRRNTFNYQNLLASCSGSVRIEDSDGKRQSPRRIKENLRHCNNKKAENPMPISPLYHSCESRFKFTVDGNIYPASEGNDEVIQTIHVLGLDSTILVRKRKAAIARVLYPDPPDEEGKRSNRRISKEEGLAKIEELRMRIDNRYEPFCIAIIQVIEQNVL